MNDMLSMLIEITLYSGIIFAASMIFKKAFKNKISPNLHLWIWWVLIARLMLPITFESGIHFITASEVVETGEIALETQNDILTSPAPTYIVQSDENIPFHNVQPSFPIQSTPIQNNVIKMPVINWNWQNAFVALWIVGICVSIIRSLIGYFSLKKNTAQRAVNPTPELYELLNKCKDELGINKDIKLIVQYELTSPALVIPNIILIPFDVIKMDESKIKIVIMHELTHFRRKDQILSILLLLLRTVYWFNPFVYMAFRQIRADIETACDNDIVSNWNIERRNEYAYTLLMMFDREGCENLMLGMSSGNTRKNAEKRIRGIYMENKSKLGTKVVAVLASCVIGVSCFTTACQPTPEKDIVVGKNDGKLESIIDSSNSQREKESQPKESQTDLYTRLGVPKSWKETIEEEKEVFKINIDIPINLPNVSKLPVATVKRRIFTQDEIDKVGEVLFGKDAVYKENLYFTKEELELRIIEERRFLQEMKAEGDELFIEKARVGIENLQEMYNNAPYESELKNIDLTLTSREGLSNIYKTTFALSASTMFDDEKYIFEVTNSVEDNAVAMVASIDGLFMGSINIEKPFGVSITKEDASKKAIDIASQLTDELQLSHVGIALSSDYATNNTKRKVGWACVFSRNINGISSTYTVNDVGSDMESELKAPVRYEEMVIVIDDKGVVRFSWINPLEMVEINNDNVDLLPFHEIRQIAINQLKLRYSKDNLRYDSENDKLELSAKVTGVQLGLMRVDIKDSKEYYYLPIWDIYSEMVYPGVSRDYVDEHSNFSVSEGYAPETFNSITINAIDGSILNRYTGN